MSISIDIWSDIVCPFCYIGKRRLERALDEFEGKAEVQLIWHSFQLDPDTQAQPGKDLYAYLAERKGRTREWSLQLHQQVTAMAASVGLDYQFDKAVVANSFDAHRLLQLAKAAGLADAAEERLFRAYFTEGADIGDRDTLVWLGTEIGLDGDTVRDMLAGIAYAIEVRADIAAAEQLGVRGVPFFVINERYGISGAQPEALFLQTLERALADRQAP